MQEGMRAERSGGHSNPSAPLHWAGSNQWHMAFLLNAAQRHVTGN